MIQETPVGRTVAGFGFRSAATQASLRDALTQALKQAQLATTSVHAITLLAVAQDKADAHCLRALVAELGLPLCAVAPAHVAATPTLTENATVRVLRSSGSTAEATALATALMHGGPGAKLLHPRSVSSDHLATCAIATFDHPGTCP